MYESVYRYCGGTGTFVYETCDALGQCSAATIVVDVVPPPIQAVDDYASTPMEVPVKVYLGDNLLATTIVSPPNNSTAIRSFTTTSPNTRRLCAPPRITW